MFLEAPLDMRRGGYHELAERNARQTKKEVMPNLLCSTSGLLAIALSVGCLPAQHLQATAKFDNGLTASSSRTSTRPTVALVISTPTMAKASTGMSNGHVTMKEM